MGFSRPTTYNGENAELSIISGYIKERKVKEIVFENLVFNGRLITDDMPSKRAWFKISDMARFLVAEHVEAIVF